MADDSTRLAALQTGQVDIAYRMLGPTVTAALADPKLKVVAASGEIPMVIDFVDMWDAKSPWADARVREAASLAIDRAAIQKSFYSSLGKLRGSPVAQALQFTAAYSPTKYDPEQAKNLLKQAGVNAGDIKVTINTQTIYVNQAQAVAGYWKAVGIDATINAQDVTPFYNAWAAKTLKGVVMFSHTGAGSAALVLPNFYGVGGQYSYMQSGALPEVDALWKQQAAELEETKRVDQLKKIQQIFHDQYLYTNVFTNVSLLGVGPRVANPDEVANRPGDFFVGPLQYIQLKAQ
ncbi:MAG: hypothetical protein EPO21_24470 [Chloroflexota bacterium]|nr:MAG: hypothetical protein EPO21_24470 [Chloroflexota bacterium]